MDKSEQINELAAALAKAQSEIRPALKDSVNPFFRSKYADLGSVWDACRAPLTANGLSVAQFPAPCEPGYAALQTILMHSSGQYISSVATARLVKYDKQGNTIPSDDVQGLGSALTYLRRYSLAAVVGIVADEDDDGNAAARPASNGNGATYQKPRTQEPEPERIGPAEAAALAPLQQRAKALREAERQYLGSVPAFSQADAKNASRLQVEITRSRKALAIYSEQADDAGHLDTYLIEAARIRHEADDVPADL